MQIVIDKDKEINELKDMLNNLTDEKDIQSVNFAIILLENKGTPLRSGKWMHLSIHDWEFDCSECGFDSDEPYPYCPNCGAIMVEPIC